MAQSGSELLSSHPRFWHEIISVAVFLWPRVRRVAGQRIAQNQLDRGLIIRKTQCLRLLRSHQQVNYRNLNQFPFGVLLETSAHGQNLSILEECFHLGTIRSSSRSCAASQNV